MPSDSTKALASMGNYLFTRDALVDALVEDARRSTDHDFGRTIVPELVPHARAYTYDFLENSIPGIHPYEEIAYWRDVGTIEAYWLAHMDLLRGPPPLAFAKPRWPLHTAPYRGPPGPGIPGTIEDRLVGARGTAG